MIGPYLEDVLVQLGINVILALSLYFPLSAGQLSLGQGGFMAIGAYLASWLTATLGWPWPLAFAAAAAAAGLVGALVGLPALRPCPRLGRLAGIDAAVCARRAPLTAERKRPPQEEHCANRSPSGRATN